MARAWTLFTLAGCASAAVIGIDFGGRFLKVGVIQPGTGIDLVLNEATQRKSSSAAGFNSQDERVYGNEAQNLLGKVPKQVFILSKLLLGKGLNSESVKSFATQLYPYVFEADTVTGGVLMRYDVNATYRPEEMVAFVLSYAKQIAEGHAKTSIKDCVITIPPFFGHLERLAMLNAASIAGLNVLSLLHESTAFAFKYGFDKESEFSVESPTNVVFYDLGASSYKVSVVQFGAVLGKKNKTQGAMTVKGLGWDESLGGRDFDQIVLDFLADEFNEKALRGQDDVRKYPKAVGKLRKAAESAKDILSANAKYQMAVEALHDDRDLRMVLTRDEFVKKAADLGLWAKLLPPLESALAQANLTKEQIHRVEVVGGATRILKVKETALTFFQRKALDGALNGDEAAALGATLYAAKLSTSFRLREFGITDSYPYATSIRIAGTDDAIANADVAEDEAENEEDVNHAGARVKKGKDKLLFKAGSKMPHKKLISMTRTDDFAATLTAGEPGIGGEDDQIGLFNISGVSAAYQRLLKDEKRKVLGKPKVSVTFALSSSGLIDVSKAEMAIEMMETYEDFEMVPANETNGTTANTTDVVEPDSNDVTGNGSTGSAVNMTNATTVPMVKVAVTRERKRLHYVTLKVARQILGPYMPMTSELIQGCIARNVELLRQEQVRRTNAEAKNALESFIIDTRDKLFDVETVSTDEEREGLRLQFDEIEEWLYEDGRALDAAAYTKKRKNLTALTSPIFLRHAELEARPKAAAQAREAINWTLTILETWTSERPEITETEREKVRQMCTNFSEWLDAVEAEQNELPLTSPPAYLSTMVTSKLDPIEAEVRKLIKKPKPKAPKINKVVNSSESNATAVNETAADESTLENSVDSTTDGTGTDADIAESASSESKAEKQPKHDEL